MEAAGRPAGLPPPSSAAAGPPPSSPPAATELSPTPITPPPGARRIPLRSSRAEVRILAKEESSSFFNSRVAHILASRPLVPSLSLSSRLSLTPFAYVLYVCIVARVCASRTSRGLFALSCLSMRHYTTTYTCAPRAGMLGPPPSSEHERPRRIYGFLTIGFITSGESLVYSHLFSLAIQARTRGLRSAHRLRPLVIRISRGTRSVPIRRLHHRCIAESCMNFVGAARKGRLLVDCG